MKSKRERTTEASGERGPGGSVSTSCFESDGSDLRAKHLLSASPSVSVHSVHFSCPLHLFLSKALWAEASVSVQREGNGPGAREGQDCPGSISCTLCKRSLVQLLRSKSMVPNLTLADPLPPSFPGVEHFSPGPAHPSSPSSVSSRKGLASGKHEAPKQNRGMEIPG